jgi:hypothetical protein
VDKEMDKEFDLLIEKLNKAIEINDEETAKKMTEEVDKIISNLLSEYKNIL